MAEIQLLPAEVSAQIKSSSTILSLPNVVIGLLENSLDAAGSKIDISLDFGRASCSAEDNGHGITPADFEPEAGLGKPYHTSNRDADPERRGCYGIFLSSLAAVSILNITSRHRAHRTTNSLTFHNSIPIARQIPAPSHLALINREYGTKVVVHDLFGKLPVRVRQRPTEDSDFRLRDREWASLCRTLTGVALATGRPLSLTVKGTDKSHIFRIRTLGQAFHPAEDLQPPTLNNTFNVALVMSTLSQATGVDPSARGDWIKTSARISAVMVRAVICLEPAPSKDCQFLCIGNRYIPPDRGYDVLYEAINRRFVDSSFGAREESHRKREKGLGLTNRELKGAGRGVDRWPSFFIRVDLFSKRSQKTSSYSLSSNESNQLSEISKVIIAMMTGFLEEHHFRPRRESSSRNPLLLRKPTDVQPPFTLVDRLNNAQTSRNRQKDESNVLHLNPKTSARRDVLQDLSSDVKFPHLEKNQEVLRSTESSFVSRMKTSACYRPVSRTSEPSRVAAPEHEADTAFNENIERSEAAALTEEPFVIAEIEDQNAQSHETKDGIIRWIHPVTKENLTINARTGCVVEPSLSKRPLTADERSMNIGRQRTRIREHPRLTRTSCGLAPPRDASWASSFFNSWENPIFQKSEESIPQISLEGLEIESRGWKADPFNAANVQDSVPAISSRLSKLGLRNANVISQVDSKFILATLAPGNRTELQASGTQEILVLIDQHASDERIRVEALLAELCTPASEATKALSSPLGHKCGIEVIQLEKPLFFELHLREHAVFRKSAAHFARWGILYDLISAHTGPSSIESQKACRLVVLTLPPGIAERCRIEPKHLIEMLRGEAWKLEGSNSVPRTAMNPSSTQKEGTKSAWLHQINRCPQGILDLINSRACRSAIMFNDDLSLEQCRELVRTLADCYFPFQCAHGRPTMVPLVELGGLQSMDSAPRSSEPSAHKPVDFVEALKVWKYFDS